MTRVCVYVQVTEPKGHGASKEQSLASQEDARVRKGHATVGDVNGMESELTFTEPHCERGHRPVAPFLFPTPCPQ